MATTDQVVGVQMLALGEIRHDQNVRQELDRDEVDALAQSIALLGQLTPASVRPDPDNGGYVLIAGHKRYAALEQLGHTEIRAEIRPGGESEASERAAENIVRSQLNAYEEARAVKAMLDQDHADRRQLGHLPTPEPSPRPTLIIRELAATTATGVRTVIDDLIDLVLGLELATSTLVPCLATGLAPPALSRQQLLGLRARLRPPLQTRLGGSDDGGFELVREFRRACSSSRPIRSSNRAICPSYPDVRSSKNSTQASRPASKTASASARSIPPRFAAHHH